MPESKRDVFPVITHRDNTRTIHGHVIDPETNLLFLSTARRDANGDPFVDPDSDIDDKRANAELCRVTAEKIVAFMNGELEIDDENNPGLEETLITASLVGGGINPNAEHLRIIYPGFLPKYVALLETRSSTLLDGIEGHIAEPEAQ